MAASTKIGKPETLAGDCPSLDSLRQALYERTCELMHNNELLSSALQQLASSRPGTDESQQADLTLADLIISDNADAVGRHVIDYVIQVAWATAERELGVSLSQNTLVSPQKETLTH